MVQVGRAALEKSHGRLRADADRDGIGVSSSHLLRFYAVECGLKAALLGREGRPSTDQLPKELRTHDLRRLAKELRINASTFAGLRDCRRRAASSGTVPSAGVHEAWRYGAALDPHDEACYVAALKALDRWCRKELGG